MTADAVGEFDEGYFDRLAGAQRHWWVEGMQGIATALLGDGSGRLDALDAGCGTGAVLPWLIGVSGGNRVTGVDMSAIAIGHCHGLGLEAGLAVASVAALPFRDHRFDLVVSLDVLQHLPVDAERVAVQEMRRVLRPGGRLLVRTNAAFGRAHVAERADWRLYRPESLRRLLVDAGFEIETLSPVNCVQGLWASVASRARRVAAGHGPSEQTHGHGHVHAHPTASSEVGLGIPSPVSRARNRLLLTLLDMEARWLRRPGRTLPFGHSLYAVARRD